jgi:low affinity Fe/Cu permease
MAKRDIATKALLTWDEYKDKPAAQALPSIYAHASATSAAVCGWYWAAIRTKRRTSLGARFITFALLILGTVLPLLSGIENAVEVRLRFTQCGIAAVAAGGLLQVADRVFGWSSGWIRYVTTVTTMENLTCKFELDWAGYVLGRDGVLTDADAKPLFDMAEALELALRKLQAEETEKWAIEFNSGTALLNDLIRQQRETGARVELAARAAVAAQAWVAERAAPEA